MLAPRSSVRPNPAHDTPGNDEDATTANLLRSREATGEQWAVDAALERCSRRNWDGRKARREPL